MAADLVARETSDFLQRLIDQPRLWGNRIEVTFPGATELRVTHGLGRIPEGYIVEGRTADIRLYDGTTAASSTVLPLRSTGAGTFRLWVF